MTTFSRRFTLLAILLPAAALAQSPVADPRTSTDADLASFRAHIDFLASPTLAGRGPGLAGNRTAAEYIENHFRSLGLKPAFPAGERPGADKGIEETPSYYQAFTAGRDVKVRDATFSFTPLGPGLDPRIERQTLVLNQDYVVLGNSGTASVEGELAFVGYAIEEAAGGGGGGAQPQDASFIESDDLTGKIAVMLRFEPLGENGKSRLGQDGEWSPASAISDKVMAVVKRNAAAIILVSPPGVDDKRGHALETPEASAAWTRSLVIPAVMLSQAAGERLVKAADAHKRTLYDLRKVADKGRAGTDDGTSSVIALPAATVKLETTVARVDRVTWNLGGVLAGAGDLASEFVVIGGHYDHIGFGYQGGSVSNEYGKIHPGADDNASGTTGLLLCAERLTRHFAAAQSEPRRSILFLAFSAEEMGLIGSREFIKASPIDAASISAMLNMDMIGRLRDNRMDVFGAGTAEGFGDLIKPHLDASKIEIKLSPGGRGPSDHANFYGAGVPVLHFYTGVHPEYHTPRDTVDLIDVPGAVNIVQMITDITAAVATRPDRLRFTSTDRDSASTLSPDTGPAMRSMKVRFGIAPANYAEGDAGVAVGEVFDGTSAAEAGIKTGDRLMRWNGEAIEDVQGWMKFLVQHKPGDTVDVTVARYTDVDDEKSPTEEIVVRVTLKARNQAAR